MKEVTVKMNSKNLIIDRWPLGSALEGQEFNELTVDIVQNTEEFIRALGKTVGELPMTQLTYLMGNDENTPLIIQQILSKLYPCKEAYYKIGLASLPSFKNSAIPIKSIEEINLAGMGDGYERVDLINQSNIELRIQFDSKLVPNSKVVLGATCYFRSMEQNETAIYIGIKNCISDCFFDALEKGELYLVFQQM